MTTKVTIEANHGWPVEVTPIDVKTGNPLEGHGKILVEPNTSREVYVHSGVDLRIHEVQPDEILKQEAEQTGDDQPSVAGEKRAADDAHGDEAAV